MNLQRKVWAAIIAPFFAVALLSQVSVAATRWPNEEIRVGAGHPALVHFNKGAPDKPLVVFVPGSLFTARIAYGHPGSNDKDFLGYWLHSEGYSSLAVSYPIDTANPITDTVDPAFTIRDWGQQVAEIAKQYVDENKPNGHIIVLGWSMGGIAESVNGACTGV